MSKKRDYLHDEEPRIVDIIHREVNKVSSDLSKTYELAAPVVDIVATIFQKAPALYNILDKATHVDGRADTRDFFLSAVVSILLFRESQRSNWMQKHLSLFLLFHRCPKAVFGVLHRCGISLSYTASLESLRELSERSFEKLELWQQQGKRLMCVLDNINFRIQSSEEISTNRTKVVNATIGFIAPLRVPNPVQRGEENWPTLSPATRLRDYFYRQSPAELQACKAALVQLIGRVWAAHLPEMAFLKPLVSKPLAHAFSEHTTKVTELQGTEILFLDENKAEDVPGILDYMMVSFPISFSCCPFVAEHMNTGEPHPPPPFHGSLFSSFLSFPSHDNRT